MALLCYCLCVPLCKPLVWVVWPFLRWEHGGLGRRKGCAQAPRDSGLLGPMPSTLSGAPSCQAYAMRTSVWGVSFLSQFSALSSSSHWPRTSKILPHQPRPFLHVGGLEPPSGKPHRPGNPPAAQAEWPASARNTHTEGCELLCPAAPGALSPTLGHSGHGWCDFWCLQLSINLPGFPGFQPV